MSRHTNLKEIVKDSYIGAEGYYDENPDNDLYNYGNEDDYYDQEDYGYEQQNQ